MPRHRRTTPARIRANRRIARRHGLAMSVLAEPALAPEVDDVAREIERSVAGAELDPDCHALACRVAEAMIDLRRVRLAKLPLVAALHAEPTNARRPLGELARLDRYERRALSRRNTAAYEFAAAVRDSVGWAKARGTIHPRGQNRRRAVPTRTDGAGDFAHPTIPPRKQDVDARPSPGMTESNDEGLGRT